MFLRCVCGQKYNVKEKLAGLHVRCRKCAEPILVPPAQSLPGGPLPTGFPEPVDPMAALPEAVAGPLPGETILPEHLSDHPLMSGPAGSGTQAFPARPAPGPRPQVKRVKVDYSPVNKGLRLIFAGTVLSILCGIAAVVATVTGVAVVVALMVVGVLAGVVLSMVGYVFCIRVPARTGARPLIISATICNGLNLAVSLAKTLVTAGDPSADSPVLDLLSMGLGVATMILFLLFLKQVAEYVDNREAAHDAWSLLIFYIAVACIGIGFVLSIFLVGPFLSPQAFVIYIIVGMLSVLIVAIIWMVHFLNFINDLEFRRTARRR